MKVWNLKTMEFVRSITQHQACVLSLYVSGQWFFSGSYDTTIKVRKSRCNRVLIIVGLESGDSTGDGNSSSQC
jgi:WD40 repeat protein